jgi:hypothetical protein
LTAPKLAVPPVSCTPCATGRSGTCTCHDRCTRPTCDGLYFDTSEYQPGVHPPVTFQGRVSPVPQGVRCVGCGHDLSAKPNASVVTFEYAHLLGGFTEETDNDLAAVTTRHFICDTCAPWIEDD